MPKGTLVHKCVDRLKKRMEIGKAIAICQKRHNQSFKTGKRLRGKSGN